MRILVVGAGATGGYFGARLAQAGQDVTFLLREKRALVVEQNGLTIHSPHGDFHFQPNVLQASQLTGPYDLILLTVKSFGLEAAMKDIAPVVGENTMVMPVLNGMKHMETLSLRFGEHALIGGLCKINATLDTDGHIHQMTPMHQIIYGEADYGGHKEARCGVPGDWRQEESPANCPDANAGEINQHRRYDRAIVGRGERGQQLAGIYVPKKEPDQTKAEGKTEQRT